MNLLNTVAIVVTFNPHHPTLSRLVEVLEGQIHKVIIVDNGSAESISEWFKKDREDIHVVQLRENLGIAAAQNIAIELAKKQNAEYVALFDQDSELAFDMLPELMTAMLHLRGQGKRVACVGPRYVDRRQNNPTPFIRVEGLRLVREACGSLQEFVPVDHLIASGSLIPISTIEAVGGMTEDLFIDYVDLEWCERAKSKGYQTYGVCAAQMEHSLGDDPISFLGTAYPARSPLRHYYMMRNAMWMYRQKYVRWNWKIVDGLRLLRKYVFYTLFAKPRYKHFWMMTKGVWHGCIGKMGRYES